MTVRRWFPFAAAAIVLAVAACAGIASNKGGSASSTTAPAAPVVETTTTTAAPSNAAANPTPLAQTVGPGSAGDDVTQLQHRLVELGFDPGPADGQFGPATQMAVWAYQKLVVGLTGSDVTGKVTPDLWTKMEQSLTIHPLRPDATPTHVEVYLPSQTAVLFQDGKARLITHISSGTGKEWCEEGYCSVAITPGGVYQFGRRVDGWDDSVLGQLYNPVYFNYGVAIHGAYNVPLYPASHSCVRIPMHIAKYFPSLVKRGDQVFVFDGVKDPEAYGAQPPPFNTKDPNATTTTEATTTTVPKTTTTKPGATTTTGPAGATTTPTTAPTTTPPAATTTTVATVAPPTSAATAGAPPAAPPTPTSG
jgi:peptidoglycan hydrolase-like protein with peptidoglycan-binding domain